MLRVLIENLSDVRDEEPELLGSIHINTIDKSSEQFGSYQYIIDSNFEKSGRIDHHFLSNSLWKLVYKILQQEFGDGS